MSKAWIALSLAPAVIMFGCKQQPDTVAKVPPPNYASEPEPLPPVSINQGSPETADPDTPPATGDTGDTGTGYDPEPLPPSQPASRSYTIRKGDTLWGIATREYGSGQKWKAISAANPSVDPKKLAIGQQITLP